MMMWGRVLIDAQHPRTALGKLIGRGTSDRSQTYDNRVVSVHSGRRARSRMAKIFRKPRPHQIDEIVAIKPLGRAQRRVHQAVIEPFERIAATFDVREIGGEQTHLLA